MEVANNLLQQEEPHQYKAYAVADDDANTINKTDHHLSAAAEPEKNYRGWKVMPYVIADGEGSLLYALWYQTKLPQKRDKKKKNAWNETCEKLGSSGITANLLIYLTTVYGMESVSAATMLNVWSGTLNLAPVLGAFLSDSYLSRYTTIAVASVVSFLGMILLTLTAAVPSLHPHGTGPSAFHMAVLLASFVLLAVGAGGIRPCNLAFGADQFDPLTPAGRRGIDSFFNWYYFTSNMAMIVSSTVIIYLQSDGTWAIGLAIPAALMGLSCALFFMGTHLYVCVPPEGSPFTSLAQVLVAACRKRRLPSPRSASLFDPPHRSSLITKIAYTDQFLCLDKAAVVTPEDELTADGTAAADPWRLCTLQQVEEVKCLVRVLPVWSSGILYYVVLGVVSTYSVLQALQTDRHVGRSIFEIPAGTFIFFNMLALTLFVPVYDRLMVPALERVTKVEGGITQLQRIGMGLVLSVATMLAAAAVEWHRRRAGDSTSCFLLVPQQMLAGLSEAFAVIGHVDLYYKQVPENMRSVAGALLYLGLGIAGYGNGIIISVVHQATGWLAEDLNEGRVDLFYMVIAAMATVNLVYFLLWARWYRVKNSYAAAIAVVEENDGTTVTDSLLPPRHLQYSIVYQE